MLHHESDDAEGVNKPERVYGICVSFVLLFNLTITNFESLRLTAMSPSAGGSSGHAGYIEVRGEGCLLRTCELA
jgi:hypothetical protein